MNKPSVAPSWPPQTFSEQFPVKPLAGAANFTLDFLAVSETSYRSIWKKWFSATRTRERHSSKLNSGGVTKPWLRRGSPGCQPRPYSKVITKKRIEDFSVRAYTVEIYLRTGLGSGVTRRHRLEVGE